MRVKFGEETYAAIGGAGFATGERLGESPLIPCDDQGEPGSEPPSPTKDAVQVFAAAEVDTEIILMVGETANKAIPFGVVDRHGRITDEARSLAKKASRRSAQ